MKRRILWINIGLALVLVGALAIGYLAVFRSTAEATSGRTVPVQSGTVSETVTASGTVETAGVVDLAFSTSGTVTDVSVAVGDPVSRGDALVSIDDTAARQQVAQARASVASARDSVAQGAASDRQTATQIAAAKAAVTAAKATARVNRQGYRAAVAQAKASLTDATDSWSDACLDPNATCPNPSAWSQLRSAESSVAAAQRTYEQKQEQAHQAELTANLQVSQAQASVTQATSQAGSTCDTAGYSTSACTNAQAQVLQAQQAYESAVNSRTSTMLTNEQAVESANASISDANVALRKAQSDLMANASDAVRTARTAYDNAVQARVKGTQQDQRAITTAKESLAAQLAGQVDSSDGSAAVAAAVVGLEAAQQSQAQTTLASPIDGTVAAVNAEVGLAAGTDVSAAVVTIIPDGAFEVVAAFSEADAVSLTVGDSAAVTFEALPDSAANGVVSSIATVGSTGTDLVTYDVTITIDEAPAEVREGMSATIEVTVEQVDDTLWAPSTAITTAGGVSTVTVRANGVDTVTPVETGLVGDSGTQIVSGVSEGDQLVVTVGDSESFSGFPVGGMPGGLGGAGPAGRLGGQP